MRKLILIVVVSIFSSCDFAFYSYAYEVDNQTNDTITIKMSYNPPALTDTIIVISPNTKVEIFKNKAISGVRYIPQDNYDDDSIIPPYVSEFKIGEKDAPPELRLRKYWSYSNGIHYGIYTLTVNNQLLNEIKKD